ncbi:hypothetical protein EC973_005865 [Apophysomyces ossiformis]|uniref:VASt domain-containing protein n=1 Tax=Apophysomyces ossiformis TaxID=679940 RepID=A0A8H7ERE6_9FUNG|nr:hypothetical protein EC973_005865 [Apophysomyces ossiformis]
MEYFFASFLSRDQAFDQITGIWRAGRAIASQITHMDDDNSANEDNHSADGSDMISSGFSESDVEETISIHNDSGFALKDPKYQQEKQKSAVSVLIPKQPLTSEITEQTHQQVSSNQGALHRVETLPYDASYEPEVKREVETVTECNCSNTGEHFPHTVMDKTYNGTIQQVYNLLYNSTFLNQFLASVQKNHDIKIGQWRKGDGEAQLTRDMSYIKPLTGPIGIYICAYKLRKLGSDYQMVGPKSTNCLLKEEILHMDLNHYITQLTTTQTPDVPSGGSFCIKTRVCITRAEQRNVRVLVTAVVEFWKSSWLKSTIEKACIDGQTNYFKDLDIAMRKHMQENDKVVSENKHTKNGKQKRRTPARVRPVNNDKPIESSRGVSYIINQIVEHTTLPTDAQLLFFSVLVLVFLNLYMAIKMTRVDRELGSLSDPHHHTGEHYPKLWKTAYKKEMDSMWQKLGYLEGDTDLGAKAAAYTEERPEIMIQHIQQLEHMVQQAGQNMDEIALLVERQQENLRQQLLA